MSRRRGTNARLRRGRSGDRGFALGKFLLILALVIFFVTLAIKMVPAYLTYYQVRSVMERVVDKPELRGAGAREVLAAVDRQLNIESIRSVGRDDFGFERSGDEVVLALDYEVREHIGFNVDVLMQFDHQVVLPRP